MSDPDVSLRRLVEEDAESVWAVRLRALREHPEAFGRSYEESHATPIAAVRERLGIASAPPNGVALGAFLGGALVGTAGVARQEPERQRHKATLWGVYVAPEARGRGLARRLVAEAIVHARALPDLEQIHLMVGERSLGARAIYASLGFVPYGREPRANRLGPGDYLDEDLMVLFLVEGPAG